MTLSWVQIFRLGLVQASLGAIVVLTTSTLNRIMVVELALPAALPGLLVALHYAVQVTRPNWGFASDSGHRRTVFIIAGMAVLAVGAMLAACAVTLFAGHYWMALGLSLLAYLLIGLGVGCAGTSLLAMLAAATAPSRRAAAAMVTWLTMIFGIAVTAGVVGHMIEPYSEATLLRVVGTVGAAAVLVTTFAVWGIERGLTPAVSYNTSDMPYRKALAEVWAEPKARNFTFFVFLSMTAYFMQELILEPYAGLVFGFSPGQSTALGGPQHGGAFVGMVLVGVLSSLLRIGSLKTWVVTGCAGSAAALALIAAIGQAGVGALVPAVAVLGFFNGVFAVAAIGSMMALAGDGRARREGTRMGLWGAAQAIAAGFGGLAGAAAVDVARLALGPADAFGLVFLAEAALFVAAAIMAFRILGGAAARSAGELVPGE